VADGTLAVACDDIDREIGSRTARASGGAVAAIAYDAACDPEYDVGSRTARNGVGAAAVSDAACVIHCECGPRTASADGDAAVAHEDASIVDHDFTIDPGNDRGQSTLPQLPLLVH
jgi:hypothetical protein